MNEKENLCSQHSFMHEIALEKFQKLYDKRAEE